MGDKGGNISHQDQAFLQNNIKQFIIMGTEIFKDIPGYEGKYQVSNLGRIKSFVNNNIICTEFFKNAGINKDGYNFVMLHKDGKRFNCLVHRLVAKAFISNPENKRTVNHIDGDKFNNNLTNLEFATDFENVNHYHRNKTHKKI